jgi:very-short-patch-repair endonuclease
LKKYKSGYEIDLEGVMVYKKVISQDCESYPESMFVHVLQKWTDCHVESQVVGKGYRADFVLDNRIVVEIDGKDYHNDKDDYIRDQKVLKDFEHVIRFRASDALYNASLCCVHLIKAYPKLFCKRGLEQAYRRVKTCDDIHQIDEPPTTYKTKTYMKFLYRCKFMTPENHHKYFSDMEMYPERMFDVLDYCYDKDFIVKELKREWI